MAQQKNDDPSVPSASYTEMAPRWDLINAVLGGTETMRAAGEAYLPMHDKETDENYKDRLNSATLLNVLEETIGTLTGRPFSYPITVGDNVPGPVKDLLDDVDLQGNNLDVFARNWFSVGMAKGFCSVLVEFPTKDPAVQTKEDEARAALRPYFVMVHPEQILAGRSKVINGVETLTHVRILETVTETDGFLDIETQQIRVLEPGTVTIFKQQKTKGGKIAWVEQEKVVTKLKYIPLVTAYFAPRQGLFLCKPPLLDLAEINKTHWQSTADQRNILTVARFPLLAASGVEHDPKQPLTIGPKKVLYCANPQGKYYYVEHTGTAIKAGVEDLQMLENQMAVYGAEFLKVKPGTQTATEKSINTAEASSRLKALVGMFQDSVNLALAYTADWLGLGKDGGTVEISTELTETPENNANDLTVIREARKAKDISQAQYLKELKDRGILSDEFDEKANAKELGEEGLVLTAQDMTALLALEQGDVISFTELRNMLRRARVATEKDEAVKEENDQKMKTGPGVAGAAGFPKPGQGDDTEDDTEDDTTPATEPGQDNTPGE